MGLLSLATINRLSAQTLRNSRNFLTVNVNLNGKSQFNNLRSFWQLTVKKSFTTERNVLLVSLRSVKLNSYVKVGLGFGGCLAFGLLSNGQLLPNLRMSQAFCQASEQERSRVSASNSQEDKQDPDFPWKEFLKILFPDTLFLIGAVVSALAVAITNIQIPLLLGAVVNVLTHFTGEGSDNGSNFFAAIQGPALKLVTIYGVQGLLTFVYISLLSAVGERVAARMRKAFFKTIVSQDIAFFDSHKTGEIVNRLTTDIQDFKSSFKLCISQGLRSLTQVIGCIVSLFILSPRLTTIMVVVVPSMIGLGSLMGHFLRRLSRKAQAQVAKSTAVADEAIGNIRTVRAFAMEDKEMMLYAREVDQSSHANQLLGIGIGVFQGLSNIALNGIVLGTLYIGGHLVSSHQIQAGDLMSFLAATQTIQRSLAQLSLLFGQAVRGVSAGARVFEYMLMKPALPIAGGKKIAFHSLVGDVEFKDVTFSYPTRPSQVVLEKFNLTIPHGHIVAMVGLSGGGKSTVAALLERFYDVDAGSITIDGHDLKTLDPKWLHGRAIGYISQEPVLFATSVMENIRYGRPEATDQEVIEAAKLANAHSFVESFPEGYSTVLGERGVTVSGGQKQRIAIARALIKNPSIIILDEATSALDSESEKLVQQALDQVIKGRTVLVIAHRLSTVRNADLIAVVAGGKIVEKGKHDELTAKKGVYWSLMKAQEAEQGEGGGGGWWRRG